MGTDRYRRFPLLGANEFQILRKIKKHDWRRSRAAFA